MERTIVESRIVESWILMKVDNEDGPMKWLQSSATLQWAWSLRAQKNQPRFVLFYDNV